MFCKKGVLILSTSENTCVGVFLFSGVAEDRSSPPEVFLGKGVLKICNKFTGEHPWQSVISIKLQSNFFEITLAWDFSCKFAGYFQNTFLIEHLLATTSDNRDIYRDSGTGVFL